MQFIELIGKENEEDVKAILDDETNTLTITGRGQMRDGGVFKDRRSLVHTIIIEKGVLNIGIDAFRNCENVTEVNIDDFVEEIECGAFWNCKSLKEIVLPTGLKRMSTYVFYSCHALTKITIKAINVDYHLPVLASGKKLLASVNTESHTDVTRLLGVSQNWFRLGWGDRNEDGSRKAAIDCYVEVNGATSEGLLLNMCRPGNENDVMRIYEETSNNGARFSSIMIKRYPDKMKYALGETLDLAGIQMVGADRNGPFIYEFGGQNLTTEGFDSSVEGEQEITVTYTDDNGYSYTDSFTIKVSSKATVTWLGFYNEVRSTQELNAGEAGTPPVLDYGDAFDAQWNFTGWDKDYTAVYDDMIIRPVYEKRTFAVNFINHKGTVIKTETVECGKSATAPNPPEREGYIFTGWDKAYTNIKEDTTISAQYIKDIKVQSIIVEKNISVKKSKEYELNASVFPEDATVTKLNYESENDDIAQVDSEGTVTGIAAGSTTIIISATDGSGVIETCTVTVTANEALNALHIAPSELYCAVGKSEQLDVFIDAGEDADTELSWWSSNTSIATVGGNGVIKGIKAGEATITATFVKKREISDKCIVKVEAKTVYIDEIYADDSVDKQTVIHSIDGKFSDITNKEIVAESLEIKEAISTSAPLLLGGCISNSFKILINAKRFLTKEPTGEIEVYQIVKGYKVPLFRGIIYSAERQDDKLTRQIIAYDKMHTAYDTPIASFIKKQSFPIRAKKLKNLVLQKVGITEKKTDLSQDANPIYRYYTTYQKTVTQNGGKVKEKRKQIHYDIPDDLTAGDFIKDYCEASGVWGWINRNGVLEYITWKDRTSSDYNKTLRPIVGTFKTGDRYYPVKKVKCEIDEVDEPMVRGSGNQQYTISDENIMLEIGSWGGSLEQPYLDKYNGLIVLDILTQEQLKKYPWNFNYIHAEAANSIYDCLENKIIMPITVTQKFRPSWKVGDYIFYHNKKELSDGSTFEWDTKSAILERTITGTQHMRDTIEAKVSIYSNKATRGKTVKYKLSTAGKKIAALDEKTF